MCNPVFFAPLAPLVTGTTAAAAGTAAAGTAAATGAAAAGTTAAATGAAAAGTTAAATTAAATTAALKTAALTTGAGLLAGKLLTPKLPGAVGAAPPENTDPSGKVASLDARRRAKLAGGLQSTLLTRGTSAVTPGQKTLLGQ